MPAQEQQVWDLWIPDVGATGISFARGRLDATACCASEMTEKFYRFLASCFFRS